jgi:hypothetical protein
MYVLSAIYYHIILLVACFPTAVHVLLASFLIHVRLSKPLHNKIVHCLVVLKYPSSVLNIFACFVRYRNLFTVIPYIL